MNNNSWNCSPIRAISMWGIAACFIMIQFFIQLSLGVIAKQLRVDLEIDAIGLSLLAGSYYIVYMLLQTPAGFVIDHLGLRKVLTLGGLICALGCLLFASGSDLYLVMVGRILMGGGLAFAFIGSLSIARSWFPNRFYVHMVGAAETVAMLGAFSGNMILERLMHIMAWTTFYLFMMIFVIIMSTLAWFIIKDDPTLTESPVVTSSRWTVLKENLKDLLGRSSVWIVGMYAGLCYMVPTIFAALWGIPFLVKTQQMLHFNATVACSILYIGLGIGAPLISGLFSHHPKRKLFMTLNPLILSGILIFLILTPNIPHPLIYMLTFIAGIQSGGLVICYTVASEISHPRARNTCLGVINTFALGLTPVGQGIIGWVLDLQSDVLSKNNIEVYSAANYKTALIILPLFTLIATGLGFFFPKTPEKQG